MRTKLIVAAVVAAGLTGGAYMYRSVMTPADSTAPRTASDNTRPAPTVADVEAKAFIEKLTKPRAEPIAAAKAAHFVTKDQLVAFPVPRAARTTTAPQLPQRTTTAPQLPQRTTTALQLPQRTTLDADKPTQVATAGDAIVIEQIAQRAVGGTDRRAVPDQLAVANARQPDIDRLRADPELRALTTMPESIDAATIGQILRQHGKKVHSEDLFYVHTVRDVDRQGIWGIIHSGIIQSFGRGLAVHTESKVDTLSVTIPRDADEMLGDQSSSFLGRLIYRKTNQSYVYNFKKQRMGDNPNLLRPGQEIVIVTFRPSELISIYKHFARNQG